MKFLITFFCVLASMMQALDTTIANVALPYMQGSLTATQDQITWILTSYIVASAIMMPISGWLAERFGRKTVFLASIASFALSSVFCGIAEDLVAMVVFRFIQGISGAALIPLSQSIILSINSKEDYPKAMGIWVAGVMMGPIIGPLIGGWLTENYSWRWVFYLNVPCAIVSFMGIYFCLSESDKKIRPFDFWGFITLSITLTALQLFLDRGSFKDWFFSTEIIIEALCCGVFFFFFLFHAFTSDNLYINKKLFLDSNFTISTILSVANSIALWSTLTFLSLMLQSTLNYPVDITGIVLAPIGIGLMVSMSLVTMIPEKMIDKRLILVIGILITAYSLWKMMQYSLLTDTHAIITAGLFQGAGIGLTYRTMSAVAFSTLPQELHGDGTAFFNFMRYLGSSLGIAALNTLFTRHKQILHSTLVNDIIPYHRNNEIAYTSQHIDTTTRVGIAKLDVIINNQAMMIAYIDNYKWIFIATLLTLFLIPFLRKQVNL